MSAPVIAIQRTLVRHERGTLVILIVVLLLCNLAVFGLSWHLFWREQLFSVPDIYSATDLQIQWGGHD